MDVKAMARSKRSHTKHHQPKKPHRPKSPSTPSSFSPLSNDSKVVKEGERKRSSLGNSLPSNWDRYNDSQEDDEVFGSLSELASGSARDAAKTDVVKPKSKGADFGFLISQAKSQSPSNFSPSFDDRLPVEFSQGLGSMLSVRGENMLSWTGDDNFLLEDEATTSQEADLFTLNLQTLAEELARIDIAHRLFIEEDILPPELRVPRKIGRQSSEAGDLPSQREPTPSSFMQEREWDDHAAYPRESFEANQAAAADKGLPRFEAKAAEAELDMLLDSFNESNVDSIVPSTNSTGLDMSRSSMPANNMDNDIDDLLNLTSNVSFQHGISQPMEVNADSIDKLLNVSSHPGTKSKVKEDFDSWLDTI